MKHIYFLRPYVLVKFIVIVSSFICFNGFSQDLTPRLFTIQGQLIDKTNKTVLPYAHIYNKRTKLGSVTDEEGYFGVQHNRIGDTLSVSFIGYHTKEVVLKHDKPMLIELKENVQELSELTLEYDNSDYLYQLIQNCAKNKLKVSAKGKAYYELHTYLNNKQIELVENFYNATVHGYDLEHLQLKNGRLGVQIHENGGTFASLESSKAIIESTLIDDAEYFYQNPFQLSGKKLRKMYDLNVFKSFKSDDGEILVIRFVPKLDKYNLFSGLVWINKTHHRVRKINLECEDCKVHPFRVVTHDDRKIDRLDLQIAKTFEHKDNGMVLNHIDFTYNLKYTRKQYTLDVKTQVLVHIYNFNEAFDLPKFNAGDEDRHSKDYREIGEAPYNTFFWENHNEFSVFDKGNENEIYFNHPNTIQGDEYLHNFKLSGSSISEFFEHPSFKWSKKRLRFAPPREEKDTNTVFKAYEHDRFQPARDIQFKSDMYKFYSKIYLDRNEYNGVVDIVVESIFDSSRSYYKLPVDWTVQVFVNMYFDLVEIEKRKLVEQINASDKSMNTVNELYKQSELKLAEIHKKYLKEIRRGENKEAMEKWNNHILSKLKINNMEAFIHTDAQ